MRTSVNVDPSDPDETDEFPECSGNVEEGGILVIVAVADSSVETTYQPGAWVSFTTTAE